jgi:hypothetical protein
MIPIALSPKLLGVKHAAYCTIVSPPSPKGLGEAHNLRTDSHRNTNLHTEVRVLGPELSDAECRRESRQALTGSTGVRRHRLKITPNFSFAGKTAAKQCLCVCKETQRWRGGPLGRERWVWSCVVL